MANMTATDSAAANTSKKRKTTDAEPAPAKKRATTKATTKKSAEPKTAETKTPATKAAAAKAAPSKAATAKKPATKATATKNTTTKTAEKTSTKASEKVAGAALEKSNGKTAAKPAATKKSAAKPAPAKKTAPKVASPDADAADDGDAIMTNGVDDAEEEEPVTTKRKAEEEEVEREAPKKAAPAKKVKASTAKPKPVINEVPSDKLNVYVFGEGSAGELGLGSRGNVIDVKRPRLNPNLSASAVGAVQVAAGGMHAVALTHDNQILTWGVNDQGALGRDTKHDEKLKDIDDDDSDAGSDNGLNPVEATPRPIALDNVPEGTEWSSVAAGDSITMAVTKTGLVYGCGTFRSNDGILGFSSTSRVQTTFTQVHPLKNITSLVCGDNHVLALDKKGNVSAWGSGQQNQLGRRVIERTRLNGLVPREFGLPRNKITAIAAGGYHSFAIDNKNDVWAWGLNTFGETGCEDDVGEDEAVVLRPSLVGTLKGKHVVAIDGGAHHSIAITKAGEVLAFGRCDGSQSGLDAAAMKELPEGQVFYDEKEKARLLTQPTVVPGIPKEATMVAIGVDSNIVLTKSGKAYSWGFSTNYQTGLGTEDDVPTPTMIDNTATRDKVLTWAGAGGQFGMLASKAG